MNVQDVLEAALKLAVELAQQVPVDTSPSQRQVSEDRASGGLENTVTAADAAQVFADLLGSELNGAKLNAPGWIFAPGRVLWQQRAFTAATDLLLQAGSFTTRQKSSKRLPSHHADSASGVTHAAASQAYAASETDSLCWSTVSGLSKRYVLLGNSRECGAVLMHSGVWEGRAAGGCGAVYGGDTVPGAAAVGCRPRRAGGGCEGRLRSHAAGRADVADRPGDLRRRRR